MKVLVVADDLQRGTFLARILRDQRYSVGVCSLGQDAAAVARTDAHDVVIVDGSLPATDGPAVCRDMREAGCHAPILLLGDRAEPAHRVLALRSGADDYLVRPFEDEQLVARLCALARHGPPSKLRIGDIEISRADRRVTVRGQPVDLTMREYALLLQLAMSGGAIVSRGALLADVWGMTSDPGTHLVDVHVSRIRYKLGPFASWIETVRGLGYRLRVKRAA